MYSIFLFVFHSKDGDKLSLMVVTYSIILVSFDFVVKWRDNFENVNMVIFFLFLWRPKNRQIKCCNLIIVSITSKIIFIYFNGNDYLGYLMWNSSYLLSKDILCWDFVASRNCLIIGFVFFTCSYPTYTSLNLAMWLTFKAIYSCSVPWNVEMKNESNTI